MTHRLLPVVQDLGTAGGKPVYEGERTSYYHSKRERGQVF